ncbi:MAG: hypothetical protein A2381_15360 [Bdellovibrionales bacterium RIFOXYB1_FULL_37_110]|nr:MAG: hypothetical protein A2417_07210 [Bdellovibrionales bacterium RIFOXYC1_FULL_37_79]OFZ57000.1 MAG: hypothetical protein A2381_15360 [Bdellovibrionales bacterium RIFOXYB1_FULL_37_110]OFZ63999.1 MAG: hypothetical protein A2577_15975 [Bdellovibrionales bacterium RIFOXYD1_FULL_36_51]
MIKKPNAPFKRAPLHPFSIKALKKGHPWVTKDEYSSKFSKDTPFIIGTDHKQNDVALLINDPAHPQIKARLWSTKTPLPEEYYNFKHELDHRLMQSIKKRNLPQLMGERQNFYLVFGEADFLPALFILLVGEHLLVQSYSSFWDKYKNEISKSLKKHLTTLPVKTLTYQKRNLDNQKPSSAFDKTFVIQEFGINYQIKLDHYDIGIYTDMAAIRKSLVPYFKKARHLLNLFSYTGSFSLLGLDQQVSEVVSVDISNTYNEWLLKNLSLNKRLDSRHHQLQKTSVDEAVLHFIKANKTFDLIICDPPSFSSSKIKTQNSFKGYEELLPSLEKITASGGHLVVFINTHKINRHKFEKKITDILSKFKLQKILSIEKTLGLSTDCPIIKPFPEGDYLKGIILKKHED